MTTTTTTTTCTSTSAAVVVAEVMHGMNNDVFEELMEYMKEY